MTLPRLYPIVDLGRLAILRLDPVAATQAVLDGGATIVQWRSKHGLEREAVELCRKASEIARQYGAQFIVNDRADLALLVRAGLHVGQSDLPAAAARFLLGSHAVVGLSTHNAAQLTEAESSGIDLHYLALGPIYQTGSKENPDPVVGCEGLSRCRSLTARPLVAIGGITRENALAVLDAGADSVAVISDLFPEPCTPSAVRRRMEEWINLVN